MKKGSWRTGVLASFFCGNLRKISENQRKISENLREIFVKMFFKPQSARSFMQSAQRKLQIENLKS